MELLAKHKITFIVLARYMQVISEQMINAYPNSQHIEQAMRHFRNEYSHTRFHIREIKTEIHFILLPIDMLARYTAGEWNVEIPLIISNHPDLQHVAERFGIPFYKCR